MLKISVITPSYNQAQYLEDTILSVLNQGYQNLEYIIIDGGSTDGSLEIIKKYKNELSYWVSEPDEGQSDAINKGLKIATGDIVAWLNSDDMYLPNTLNKVARIFSNDDKLDLIYGDVINFGEGLNESIWEVHEFDPIDFLKRTYIHQPAVFWKRKLHDEIGYLDTELYYQMDYDLWVRIFLSRKTQKVYDCLAKFRIHDTAKTSSNPPGMYIDYRKVFSRVVNSLENKELKNKLIELKIYDNPNDISYEIRYPFTVLLIKQIIDNYIYNCAIQEYTFGEFSKANKLFYSLIGTKHTLKSLVFLIKNILGINRLKSKM